MKFSTTFACAAISLAYSASALPTITRAGRYLFSADGTRFFIKGVAYQEQGTLASTPSGGFPEPANFVDPLVNITTCTRDIPLLTQLGVNTIRVYSVDSSRNHDACMAAFSAANIYVIVDLTVPIIGSINRDAPLWTTDLLNVYLETVDTFMGYDNILAFTVGNEVVTAVNETVAGPFIKAAARDVKAYLKSKGSSALTTYASTDGPAWRTLLAQYLACGSDETSLDLYGLNNYEWQGNASIASYSGTNTAFQEYNIPAYFSEFGSNAVSPRPFTEVAALFGTSMTPIWSGGLAFSYFPALASGFALVNIGTDGSVTTTQDFTNLQTQFGEVTFDTSITQSAAGTTSFPACAAPDGVNFLGSTTLPPTPDEAACDCAVQKGFSCTFTPQTTNATSVNVIEGALLDFTCGQLGQLGLTSCNQFSAFGNNGSYALLSYCGLSAQVSFAFSAFYEANNRNPQSCSFSGNATVNSGAPGTATAAEAAVTSCLAAAPSTFTATGPAAPSGTSTGGSTSGSSGSTSGTGGGSGSSSAGHPSVDLKSAFSMTLFATVATALGAWTIVL